MTGWSSGAAAKSGTGNTVVPRFDDSDTSPEEGEATLKTCKRVGGHVWLLPENPNYVPILGDGAIILGKVVCVPHGPLSGRAENLAH